jgi:hypothetical protein
MTAPEGYTATPIAPAALDGLGGWPVPRLDVPFALMGLRPLQWCYMLGAFLVWDSAGRVAGAAGLPYPWPASAAVFVAGVLVAAAGCLVRWHGLHLLAALRVQLQYGATPRVAVWRPYDDSLAERPEWDALEGAWERARRDRERGVRRGGTSDAAAR